jgi:hypothetical protein
MVITDYWQGASLASNFSTHGAHSEAPMHKHISFAITLFADALAVTPAFAGDAVALIEGLTTFRRKIG